jgi:hypothetical protein
VPFIACRHTHKPTQQNPTTKLAAGLRADQQSNDKKIATKTMTTQSPEKSRDLVVDARVHYPKTKQPKHKPHTSTSRQSSAGHLLQRGGLISQGPTVCQHPPASTTGHRKVPHQATPPPAPPVREGPAQSNPAVLVRVPAPRRGPCVDDSTSEHPSAAGTNAPRAVPNEWVGVCSLERR